MLAKVEIYDDNNAIIDEYVIKPINVIDNGSSTAHQFAFTYFTYDQSNCQYRSDRTDISTINGVNVDGGWEPR